MINDPSNAESPLDEQLVAYLDGELDPESRSRIESLLAADPEVRRRMQSLEQTWDLLDELDAEPLGERFTRTTLEMVAVAAGEDVEKDRAEAPRRRRRWLLAAGGSLLAALTVGFLAVAFGFDPNRQLLEDLPVLENLDEYRQVESMEYLLILREEKLFLGKNSDSTRTNAAESGTLAERRRFVENMGPSDREELARCQDIFEHLDPEEQESLRRLHRELQKSPDAEQLRAIMVRYCDWLKALPSLSHVELAGLASSADRIAWVKNRLGEESKREEGRRLMGRDAEALRKWLNEFVTLHEAELLKMLPEKRQKEIPDWDKPLRHNAALGKMWQRWQETRSERPPFATDKDLTGLRKELSPDTRKSLEGKPSAQQWLQVAIWMHQGMRRSAMPRGLRGPMPRANDDRLANFFENELDEEERERLLGLPGEEMQRELLRLFITRTRPPGEPRFHPDGPPRDVPPGL
jgi:hypothetical protein